MLTSHRDRLTKDADSAAYLNRLKPCGVILMAVAMTGLFDWKDTKSLLQLHSPQSACSSTYNNGNKSDTLVCRILLRYN